MIKNLCSVEKNDVYAFRRIIVNYPSSINGQATVHVQVSERATLINASAFDGNCLFPVSIDRLAAALVRIFHIARTVIDMPHQPIRSLVSSSGVTPVAPK